MPGSVTVTSSPGPIAGVAAAANSASSRAASSAGRCSSPARRRAALGVHLGGQPVRRSPRRRRCGSRRPARCRPAPAASRRFTGATDSRLRRPPRRTPPRSVSARQQLSSAPVRSRPRGSVAGAADGRGRVTRVEVIGEQRTQQRRHRDALRRTRFVVVAAGLGVIATQRTRGINHVRVSPAPTGDAGQSPDHHPHLHQVQHRRPQVQRHPPDQEGPSDGQDRPGSTGRRTGPAARTAARTSTRTWRPCPDR